MDGKKSIRVLIVDDQCILRESLQELIERDKEITVIGGASNGKEALKVCEYKKPDIVMMDIRMPVCDGIEGTKLIKAKYPDIKVIILTTFEDDEYIFQALLAGAEGYILKDISPSILSIVIKGVANDLPIIHKIAFDKIIDSVTRQRKQEQTTNNEFMLTEKELYIIRGIVEGKSNRTIAQKIHLSEGRVRNIITDIFTKFGVKDRTQLAVFAVRNNLI